MRFYLGETFRLDLPESRQFAMVVALEGNGRRATLRVFDTNEEFIADWAEFHQQPMWQRVRLAD